MAKKTRHPRHPRHPMQPIEFDEHGVVRFKQNKIVRHLIDSHPHVDMNALATMNFSREDHEQFAQLIGYSVSGFGDLSYASKKAVAAADATAAKLTKRRAKK